MLFNLNRGGVAGECDHESVIQLEHQLEAMDEQVSDDIVDDWLDKSHVTDENVVDWILEQEAEPADVIETQSSPDELCKMANGFRHTKVSFMFACS